MDDWVPWCRQHTASLGERVRAAADDRAAVDTFFGAGLVDGQWRVGYHLADRLVADLGATLPELAALPVEDACRAVSDALAVI
jgi:hypothetical protein